MAARKVEKSSYALDCVYIPTDEERRLLLGARDDVENHPERLRDWDDVRAEFRSEP